MFFAAAVLTACAPGREWEAAQLLFDIAAGPGPSRLKRITHPPNRVTVSFPSGHGDLSGDLYLPGQPSRAGILLLPGAAEEGKDDPRLRAFATSLARAHFAVLVPDLKGFRSLRVGSVDIGDTVAAFRWLVSQPRLAPGGRAGMCVFSYAAGPAMFAALDPAIRERIRFVVTVGAYHNLVDVIRFFTTGYFREGGAWRFREPNRYGMWVFVAANAGRLSDPDDRYLLTEAAARKLKDLAAPVDDLFSLLGPEGTSLAELILNRDPSKVSLLVGRLPPGIRREVEALDLSRRDLGQFRGQAILLHGVDDDIIPYTESISLAKALPRGRAHLFLVRGLMHVDLNPRPTDAFRLWRAMSALLKERDGG